MPAGGAGGSSGNVRGRRTVGRDRRRNRHDAARGGNGAAEPEAAIVPAAARSSPPPAWNALGGAPNGGSDLVLFREGDHAGEAPYDKIRAGYKDGELGEACEVFAGTGDEWVSIAEFLQKREGGGAARTAAAADDGTASRRKRRRILAASKRRRRILAAMRRIRA